MKKIAILHTIKDVCLSFGNQLKSAVPEEELAIYDTLDEFLAVNTNLYGFTPQNINRLYLILKAMELEEPDIIACTCTTMSAGIERLRDMISVPIVAIDDALCRKAVEMAEKIAVLASAPGLVKPIGEKLASLGAKSGKEVEPVSYLCPEALVNLRRGDRAAHDRIVMEQAAKIKGQEIVILPQASMAHLAGEIEASTGLPTLSCPELCIEYLRELITSKQQG